MKYGQLLVFLLLSACLQLNLIGQGEQLFNNSSVHEIRVSINDTDYWNILLDNYNNNYPDVPYVMANVEIDGTSVDSIGIRLKGFASFWVFTDKKSMKLDFNKFVLGKKFDGLKKINLNNAEGDPSLQRDFICYDIHRNAGVDAPRTSYAKVYLNEEYWGLYVLVEQIDKTFLNNNFDNANGRLFKNMANSDLNWLGSDSTAYQKIFELKTDQGENNWDDFVNLMDIINNSSDQEFKDKISKVFDVKRFLKVLAIDIATNNWDSYLEHGRNFYLYQNTVTNKFNWIPWDYNFAIGGIFSFGGGPGGSGLINVIEYPSACLTITNGSCPYPVTDSVFIQVINQDNFCCESAWDETCQSLYDKIEENDGQSTVDTTGTNTGNGGINLFTGPIVQNFPIDMPNESKVLIKRLLDIPEFKQQYYKGWCSLLNSTFSEERIMPIIKSNTDMIRNAIYEDPNYMFSTDEFEADIKQGSGQIYGLGKFFSEMPGLLKADLNNHFDCSQLQSLLDFNDVVINEFVSSNDSLSGIADQSGKYADWIELFNNTNDDIDLSNAFMTDKRSKPDKWEFPANTIIPANGYLIIWADDDEEEEGLHTNFNLSKEGDFLMLTDGTSVLDSLEFSEQTTNLSSSRIPNGTGDYVIKDATFNFNNELPSGLDNLSDLVIDVNIYPNPTAEDLNITLSDFSNTNLKIEITNSIGQSIIQKAITKKETKLKVTDYPTGIYHFKLIDNLEKQITLQKFIIL